MKVSSATERGTRTLGQALSPRKNSLNFLRVVLAVSVIVSHAFAFGRFGSWDQDNGTSLGTVAVYGFFGISGYLIAGSALRDRPGRFLWQRFLRIFPAFWVCIAVTAVLFGFIAYRSASHSCGSYWCYLDTKQSPLDYIYNNALLKVNQLSIAGTPTGPYPRVAWFDWNPSLWTLLYEFLCYLILLALAITRILQRRGLVLGIAVALFTAIAVISLDGHLARRFNAFQNWIPMNLMKFTMIFLVGALLYLFRDKVPDSGWIAVGATLLFFASLSLPTRGERVELFFSESTMFGFLAVYPLLWLGAHLHLDRIGARNDYSYGFYIFGYPVQQLLAIAGAGRFGLVPFAVLSIVAAAPPAVASWWLVERHALKLKHFNLDRLLGPPQTKVAPLPPEA